MYTLRAGISLACSRCVFLAAYQTAEPFHFSYWLELSFSIGPLVCVGRCDGEASSMCASRTVLALCLKNKTVERATLNPSHTRDRPAVFWRATNHCADSLRLSLQRPFDLTRSRCGFGPNRHWLIAACCQERGHWFVAIDVNAVKFLDFNTFHSFNFFKCIFLSHTKRQHVLKDSNYQR